MAAENAKAETEEIGLEFTEAAQAVQRLIVADMEYAKAKGLAKLAKDAAAVGGGAKRFGGRGDGGHCPGHQGGRVSWTPRAGPVRRFPALTETEEKQVRYNAVMAEGAKI